MRRCSRARSRSRCPTHASTVRRRTSRTRKRASKGRRVSTRLGFLSNRGGPMMQAMVSIRRMMSLAVVGVLLSAGSVFAQATSTINGRVLDQGDAVLPGVTVTVTNQATGVLRTGVSNGEGVYSMPGLESGTYNVTTELPGFIAPERRGVVVGVNTTITLDFKMNVAGLEQALTVTGEAPLIEVTQSKVASTIETTELQNLPMIARNVSGMLALLPGAVQIDGNHRSKTNVGSVSYGGAAGTNVIPSVDGADNRDNQFGGPLITFSTEALE